MSQVLQEKQAARFALAGRLIKSGEIKYLEEIFHVVPKYVICDYLVVNYGRFDKMFFKNRNLPQKHVQKLAERFEVPYLEFHTFLITTPTLIKIN